MSNSKELAPSLPVESSELSVGQLKGQVAKVQELMRSVMKDGVHYGSIPGIPQKFLFKAGADKLSMTFRLIPSYKVEKTSHEAGHVTYEVTCDLHHLPTGTFVGQGVGAASTLERKYRYRNEDLPTGVEVPPAWWQKRDKSNLPKILRNNGVQPKSADTMRKQGLELATSKVEGKFQIVYRKRIENPDIADLYNTVLKMAKKRAHIDATITALAVSDMFSQDPEVITGESEEDEDDNGNENKEPKSETKGRATSSRRSKKDA
jgi:hypothetical protein